VARGYLTGMGDVVGGAEARIGTAVEVVVGEASLRGGAGLVAASANGALLLSLLLLLLMEPKLAVA